MKTYDRRITLAVAASICVTLGCTKAPVTFGVVLDTDGLRGATVAMDEINAAGGIKGHRIVLRDMGGAQSTKARVAIETAETLAADPAILAVVGHTNSGASLAASQVYNARHVVQIAPTSSTPVYTNAGPYSFRLVGSDLHQAVFLANRVLARTPHPRTAVLYVNDDYGRPLHAVLLERLREGGIVPVHDAPFVERDTATRAEMVRSLARTRPELLLWIGRAYDYAPLVDALASALPDVEVLASDGFAGGTVAADSLHRLDGVSYVRLVDVRRPSAALQRMRDAYRRAQWGQPSDQALLSYDAVLVLSEAVRHAGPRREAIREWLARVGGVLPAVAGVSGPIAFLPGGDRQPLYFMEEIGRERRDSLHRQGHD